jgi:predicted MFS family arabinose efflux permease
VEALNAMTASRPPLALSPWVVVACGAAIVTLAMGARQSFGLFMRPIAFDLDIGREPFGLALALQNLLWGLAQPVVGGLADRYGAGWVTAVGAAIYAAGLALAAVVGNALGLQLTLGVLVGLALSGTTFVVVLGAVGRVVRPEQRGLAFGITTAAGSFGQFLVVPIAQAMIDGLGWRTALLATAGLVSLVGLLAIGIAGRPGGDGAGAQNLTMREALAQAARHRGYWLLNGGFFVCGFHVAFIGVHLPAFLSDSGLQPAIGAWALALIGLFNIFGSYLFGWSADHYRKKHVLAGIYLARAVAIAAFLAVPITTVSALVFAAAIGFLWLGTVPLTSSLVGQIFGVRYLSMLFGTVFLSHQVGSFLGAWAAGWAYDALGSYDAVWITAILLGLAAAALHWPIEDAPLARPVAEPAR